MAGGGEVGLCKGSERCGTCSGGEGIPLEPGSSVPSFSCACLVFLDSSSLEKAEDPRCCEDGCGRSQERRRLLEATERRNQGSVAVETLGDEEE